jgi:hypothetical protein
LEYYIAYAYVGAGKHREALPWLNRIINENSDLASDTQSWARVLTMIVHYELGNNELLEYMVKSTYRFILKKNSLYNVEKAILGFIKNMHHIKSKEEQQKEFEKPRAELIEVLKDPYEAPVVVYFNIIAWLDSKIQKRPFAEIVKERAVRV